MRLTPDAYAQGPATALPQEVALASEQVLARPTGFEFADTIPIVKRLPVKGADAWRALVESRTA